MCHFNTFALEELSINIAYIYNKTRGFKNVCLLADNRITKHHKNAL